MTPKGFTLLAPRRQHRKWLTRNTWVVGHWALFLLVTAFVWCLTALFMTAGIPRSIDGTVMLFALLALSVTLFFVIYVRVAQRHRRKVAASAVLAIAAFLVQCVPYPNIGLHFGYWAYPNRAITAFLSCPNVQSATLTGWNKDTTLEEFQITVTWSDRAGRAISHGIPFNQYPTRQDIAEKVATVGCRS